jgi:hypothetical protein
LRDVWAPKAAQAGLRHIARGQRRNSRIRLRQPVCGRTRLVFSKGFFGFSPYSGLDTRAKLSREFLATFGPHSQHYCIMNKYFLYIDILGFSQLVSTNAAKVDDLYEVVASLNVHSHWAFEAIVFSDTILVYNTVDSVQEKDKQYLVMYLCEFAKDLQYRLAGRNISFRAILTYGPFTHYTLNNIPCFYGQALIDTYHAEKSLQAIGLFIDKSCSQHCKVFDLSSFDDKYDFVHTTQSFQEVENLHEGAFPLDDFSLTQTDLGFVFAGEFLFAKYLYDNSLNQTDARVKQKYVNTIELYQRRYPKAMAALTSQNFSPATVSSLADWQKYLNRYPEDCSYVRK